MGYKRFKSDGYDQFISDLDKVFQLRGYYGANDDEGLIESDGGYITGNEFSYNLLNLPEYIAEDMIPDIIKRIETIFKEFEFAKANDYSPKGIVRVLNLILSLYRRIEGYYSE